MAFIAPWKDQLWNESFPDRNFDDLPSATNKTTIKWHISDFKISKSASSTSGITVEEMKINIYDPYQGVMYVSFSVTSNSSGLTDAIGNNAL